MFLKQHIPTVYSFLSPAMLATTKCPIPFHVINVRNDHDSPLNCQLKITSNCYILLKQLSFAESSGLRTAGKVRQDELAAWERLGEGGFSSVYKAKLKGNEVAVKVLKNLKETKPLLTEGNLLRY